MVVFEYAAATLEQFPTVVGGVILARGLKNGPTSTALTGLYQAEQAVTLERIGDTALSEIASLAAWRNAFRAFGAEPTKQRSAAEALLRRLTKKGDIPSINTLVDLGNLVSIRYGLPVAIFDRRENTGAVTVRPAVGDERFTELGSDAVKHPEPGEIIFVDAAGLVSARRWCWRQSVQSAARPDTTDVIITVEGHHEGAANDVKSAIDDLLALVHQFGGGEDSEYTQAVLDASTPSIAD